MEKTLVLDENSYYDGSRAFVWISDISGLSVDLVNFLICQLSGLFLASLFRSTLHPFKVSPKIRHAIGLSVGLIVGYICFGQQAIHIAGLPTICYIVIRTQSPLFVQRSVMIVAMFYLLCIHLHRQIYDYGSYSLDITGPLMIITQKVTSLAFSIHDGFIKDQKHMTKAQKYHAVYKTPSPLEFFSYVLNFQNILAGPFVLYKNYIDYIEGYNFLKISPTNDTTDSKEIVYEPSPIKTVLKKVIASFVCALIFMKLSSMYPIRTQSDDDFINSTSSAYKLWYVMMATTAVRFKYYHAWLLADAICNNSGLGFAGYDKDGNAKWDLISNINVLSFEFATNMRDAINNWNIGTNIWLRNIVYERVPKSYGTFLTFALSAVWHGFYPGYYLTFATGALFVTAARCARRLFRHRFQSTQYSRMFYDILTCLLTRAVMGYTCFPFVLLEFQISLRMYLKFYLCLHIIAIITIYILPKFIYAERPSKSKSSIECKYSEYNAINSNHTNLNDKKSNSNSRSHNEHSSQRKHDECEMNNLSSILREKIDIETKNIEEFIDKTVNETVIGIKEFKNDLMRKNNDDIYFNSQYEMTRNCNKIEKPEGVDAFLKKEIGAINAAVQQAKVIPVVLGNGNAK